MWIEDAIDELQKLHRDNLQSELDLISNDKGDGVTPDAPPDDQIKFGERRQVNHDRVIFIGPSNTDLDETSSNGMVHHESDVILTTVIRHNDAEKLKRKTMRMVLAERKVIEKAVDNGNTQALQYDFEDGGGIGWSSTGAAANSSAFLQVATMGVQVETRDNYA